MNEESIASTVRRPPEFRVVFARLLAIRSNWDLVVDSFVAEGYEREVVERALRRHLEQDLEDVREGRAEG
jgi:hypothetical protein